MDPPIRSVGINLDPDEIHLWGCRDANIVDSALLDRYFQQLDDAEREQCARFYFDRHRRRCLVARAMLRNTLSLYAGDVAPERWRFSRSEYRKPYISEPLDRPLRFNLSHAGGMIVLAITKNKEVGVDIEPSWREKRSGIADRFFAHSEVLDLRALPPHEQADRFCELWTLKEAYTKTRGNGLSMPLDRFAFRFRDQRDVDIEFAADIVDDAGKWKFWLFQAGDGHKAALAIRADDPDDRFRVRVREIVPARGYRDTHWPCLRSSPGF